jgi:hypothetical protein
MDWKQLTDRAKVMIDQRGGAQSVIEDAGEVKYIVGGPGTIVGGPGTIGDKAKRALDALRERGAHHDDRVLSQSGAAASQPVTREGEVSA